MGYSRQGYNGPFWRVVAHRRLRLTHGLLESYGVPTGSFWEFGAAVCVNTQKNFAAFLSQVPGGNKALLYVMN